jgi:hypothetical protein
VTEAFTVSGDGDIDQVVLEGLPTGAAGAAPLTPTRDLELIFDRADGHLARVVIGPQEPGRSVGVGPGAALLTRLFGADVLGAVRAAEKQRAAPRVFLTDQSRSAHLSRLARLDAARVTSPARSGSPLWAAEAAQLAREGGWPARAQAEARRAIASLAGVLADAPFTEALWRAASAVADLAEEVEPDMARQLRAAVAASAATRERPAKPAGPPGRGSGPGDDLEDCANDAGLACSLDPDLVPVGVFLPGLSPVSDLTVRSHGDPGRVIVRALLRPEADLEALGRCRVRLVDPAVRRVLSIASFAPPEGSQVRAELRVPFPVAELRDTAWVEVVDDEHRPVRSQRLRHLRLALRWADAALRAELTPGGLAPGLTEEEWAALAASAWERCRRYWDRAGDHARAYLASVRLADLAERGSPLDPPFLAEALGF